MPEFSNHTVLEIARGVKAFLSFSIGLTRGAVPDPARIERQLQAQTRKLKQAQGRIEQLQKPAGAPTASIEDGGEINPANIVWILGSPRTGSTWLGKILGEPKGHALWKEPFLGVVLGFRNNLANREYVNSGQFLLGEPHREVWVRSVRNLFLDVGRAKFPNISASHYLIVKEPNGSMNASLILEAFPESKLIFLVRDSRDVVSSLLEAARKGSWYGYDRYEASVVEALRNGDSVSLEDRSEDEFVEQLAKNYVTNVSAVKESYEKHPDNAKVLVRYEDLRENPSEQVARICDALNIGTERTQLEQAVEKHSWENLPAEKKGQGKFHRKATPGGWREDLTTAQAETVERITEPLLEEFYSE